jgi:hypothetical protein
VRGVELRDDWLLKGGDVLLHLLGLPILHRRPTVDVTFFVFDVPAVAGTRRL